MGIFAKTKIMKLFRNLLKGTTLTTAMFIFQACYGTPNWFNDTDIKFKVVSAADDTPLDNVGVYTRVGAYEGYDWNLCGYTGEDGILDAFVGYDERMAPEFRFKAAGDIYEVKDTVIADMTPRTIEIKLRKIDIEK